MKKIWPFTSTLVLVMLTSLSCAQSSDQTATNRSSASAPELRWKYESGG